MCEGRGQRKRGGLDQPQCDRERGHTGHRHKAHTEGSSEAEAETLKGVPV